MLNNISHTCIVNATTTTTKCQPSVVIKNKTTTKKHSKYYIANVYIIHTYAYVVCVCVCGILNASVCVHVCVSFLLAMEMLTA